MRPWQVVLENVLVLLMWLGNALGDSVMCLLLMIIHLHGGYVMLGVLGVLHFVLNAWILKFQWRNMNKCGLVFLFLTQTTPLYMLGRRAWRSLNSCCAKDERTKKRRALIAKFSLCSETWSSFEKFAVENNAVQRGSCIPSECIYSNHTSGILSNSNSDAENCDDFENQFFMENEQESQQIIPMGNTKYTGDTYNIELNFNSPQEVYAGEPNLLKFIIKILQLLFVHEKKLSYHIVTNPNNEILYVTKSDRHVRNLPARVVPGQPPKLCNDIHYALNLARGVGFEVFAVTKRTLEDISCFIDTDLSKLIWSLLWPSLIIKLYTIFDIMKNSQLHEVGYLFLLSPLFSIITWLVTQRGVSEPWRNTAICIPLRILMTVPRALLVIGIGLTSVVHAGFCFISVKIVGVITFSSYLIYSKKYKNVELYRDEIDRYTFNPIFDPFIQVSESIVYLIWAIGWYAVTTKSDLEDLASLHPPLVLLLMTLLGHVLGLTWLCFLKPYLKHPFKDPNSVLRLIQALEYVRT